MNTLRKIELHSGITMVDTKKTFRMLISVSSGEKLSGAAAKVFVCGEPVAKIVESLRALADDLEKLA